MKHPNADTVRCEEKPWTIRPSVFLVARRRSLRERDRKDKTVKRKRKGFAVIALRRVTIRVRRKTSVRIRVTKRVTRRRIYRR